MLYIFCLRLLVCLRLELLRLHLSSEYFRPLLKIQTQRVFLILLRVAILKLANERSVIDDATA